MTNSESRIAPSPEAASDDFASPSNLQPAEPTDRLAFEPVPLRYREDGLTPERQRAYVEALADCGIAREAAARVGLSEQAINRVRRRADARSFDDACEAAHMFGARRIRSVAWERAIEGTLKGRYYHGELVAEERVYDNRLLTYLYGKVAHLLEPSRESRLICDHWEAHMDALEQGQEPPGPGGEKPADPDEEEWTGYEVREDDDGVWWTSFPPPAGFDGEEQGEFGEDYYKRTLSPEEQAVLDEEFAEEDAEYRASETARRDRFFGFTGGENLFPRQAEPYGTSEPSGPPEGPIEYKSAYPPVPGPVPNAVRLERKRPSLGTVPRDGPPSPDSAAARGRSGRLRVLRVPSPETDFSRRAAKARFRCAPSPDGPPGLSMAHAKEREGREGTRHIQIPTPRHPYR